MAITSMATSVTSDGDAVSRARRATQPVRPRAAQQSSEDIEVSITQPPVIPAPALPAAARSSRARVPLDQPTGLIGRALNFYATRKYGQVLDNLLAMAHNPRSMSTHHLRLTGANMAFSSQ